MFSNKEYLNFITKSKNKGLDIVVTSVIETSGHTYAKPGNMILFNSAFESTGVLGSPVLHNKIFELSKTTLESKKLVFFENVPKDKSSGHGISKFLVQPFFFENKYGALGISLQNFGKTLIRSIGSSNFEISDRKFDIKFENGKFHQSIEAPYSLLIFGSGAHVSSLIIIANIMGWKTTVIDLNINRDYVKEADELIKLDNLENILKMNLSSYNASVILSHSPKKDDIYLEALLKSNVEYIGILGNKKNMLKKVEYFSLNEDKRIFAPVGFDIGGINHQSIALSICSQIEARKNGKI